jgi:hypothetical protein
VLDDEEDKAEAAAAASCCAFCVTPPNLRVVRLFERFSVDAAKETDEAGIGGGGGIPVGAIAV